MYKIVGADQKEYGPVAAEQLRDWIAQGRANANTLVSHDGGPWKPLSTFPELAVLLSSAPPPAPPPSYATPTYSGQVAGVPRNNAMATWGLVLSLFGLLCCPGGIASVLGIVFSIIGLNQIQSAPQNYTTTSTIPILGIVFGILGIIGTVLLYFSGFGLRALKQLQGM